MTPKKERFYCSDEDENCHIPHAGRPKRYLFKSKSRTRNASQSGSSFAIQKGSKVITRKFALLPEDPTRKRQVYKKITNRMVKFRDLENLYIQKMRAALANGSLMPDDFAKTDSPWIKSKVYDRLGLNFVLANQFRMLELKERAKRCATQYPYHAMRNWLIRGRNLVRIIEHLIGAFGKSAKLVSSFLKGKGISNPLRRRLMDALQRNRFGERQKMTYFHIDNMVGQIRNLFLEHASLDGEVLRRKQVIMGDKPAIEDFLRGALGDFYYKKKGKEINLKPADLPFYFLTRYFAAIKGRDTRFKKYRVDKDQFKRYQKVRDRKLDDIKDLLQSEVATIRGARFQRLVSLCFQKVMEEHFSDPHISPTQRVFNPIFQKSPIGEPTLRDFTKYFANVLCNKMREHLKSLFIEKGLVLRQRLREQLEKIRRHVFAYTNVPKISALSFPIVAAEQVFKPDYNHFKLKLSFCKREFFTFHIHDKKGRLAQLLGAGADPKSKFTFKPALPVITFERRKLILNLPFEVKRKPLSNRALPSKEEQAPVELGVDLGLKHFAVISVMDQSNPRKPVEINRHFIGSKQLFDMKFDEGIGKFVKRANHKNRQPSNIKLKIIHLRDEIRIIQRNKSEYEQRCLKRGVNPKEKYKFNRLSRTLSGLWERLHAINSEIVRLLNHNILAIARHHKASKIKMENLKWSRHSKKRARGRYLAFWQTHWLFGQIQDAVELQAGLHKIGFERVNARNTSQRCSICGEHQHAIRDGKRFVCKNRAAHKGHEVVRLDADLNAARNIALAS